MVHGTWEFPVNAAHIVKNSSKPLESYWSLMVDGLSWVFGVSAECALTLPVQ
jgi:hypothetical protein